jgi:hypothetical protein
MIDKFHAAFLQPLQRQERGWFYGADENLAPSKRVVRI